MDWVYGLDGGCEVRTEMVVDWGMSCMVVVKYETKWKWVTVLLNWAERGRLEMAQARGGGRGGGGVLDSG